MAASDIIYIQLLEKKSFLHFQQFQLFILFLFPIQRATETRQYRDKKSDSERYNLHDEKTPKRDADLEAFLRLPSEIQAKILKDWYNEKEEKEVEERNKLLDETKKKLSKKGKYFLIQNDRQERLEKVRERLRLKLLKKHNLVV